MTCSRAFSTEIIAQGSEPQRPALCRRDHQFGVHHACHRRQQDRKFGLEEVDEFGDLATWFCSFQ